MRYEVFIFYMILRAGFYIFLKGKWQLTFHSKSRVCTNAGAAGESRRGCVYFWRYSSWAVEAAHAPANCTFRNTAHAPHVCSWSLLFCCTCLGFVLYISHTWYVWGLCFSTSGVFSISYRAFHSCAAPPIVPCFNKVRVSIECRRFANLLSLHVWHTCT